ncbi:MAG: hypothetical protein ACR2RL_21735 [Gammaproteobacteria bacterium]
MAAEPLNPNIGDTYVTDDGEPRKFFAPGRWDTDWEALTGLPPAPTDGRPHRLEADGSGADAFAWVPRDDEGIEVWPTWGNADGVLTTGNKRLLAEVITLPDSTNSVPPPVDGQTMTVSAVSGQTWNDWGTAGGQFETEGAGPTALPALNSVAGDSNDLLALQYHAATDNWSAQFGSDVTISAAPVPVEVYKIPITGPHSSTRPNWGTPVELNGRTNVTAGGNSISIPAGTWRVRPAMTAEAMSGFSQVLLRDDADNSELPIQANGNVVLSANGDDGTGPPALAVVEGPVSVYVSCNGNITEWYSSGCNVLVERLA